MPAQKDRIPNSGETLKEGGRKTWGLDTLDDPFFKVRHQIARFL